MKNRIYRSIAALIIPCMIASYACPAVSVDAAHTHKWKKTRTRTISGTWDDSSWVVDDPAWISYDIDGERNGFECKDCGRFFEHYYGEDGWSAWCTKNMKAGHTEHGAYLSHWHYWAVDIEDHEEEGHIEHSLKKLSGIATVYHCSCCGKEKATHRHIYKPVYSYKKYNSSEQVWIPDLLPWTETIWNTHTWYECMNCHTTFNTAAEWSAHSLASASTGSRCTAYATLSKRTTEKETIEHPGTGHYENLTRKHTKQYVKYYKCVLCGKKRN